MKAIHSVGGILEAYDSDKMITSLGFGGDFPSFGKTSHCFALNGNIFNPEIFQIQGVIEAYQNTLSKVKLSGPTYFSSLINYATDMTEHFLTHNYA